MVPRPAVRRERNNDYSAVGTAGRRTGVTLPPGRLDENGLEEITGLFSSPTKQSPVKAKPAARKSEHDEDDGGGVVGLNNSTFEEEAGDAASEEMLGMNSSGLTPTQTLSARRSFGAPALPPPRSSSPRKSGISGSPRRSTGIDIRSPSKGVQVDDSADEENPPVDPTPIRVKPRRFVASPEKRPLREIVPNGEAVVSKQVNGGDNTAEADDVSESEAGNVEQQSRLEKTPMEVEMDPGLTRSGKSTEIPPDEDFAVNPMGDDEVEEFLSSIDSTIQDAVPVSRAASEITPEATGKVSASTEQQANQPHKQQKPTPIQRKSVRKRKSDEMKGETATAAPSKKPAHQPRGPNGAASKAKGKPKIGPAVGQEFAIKPVSSVSSPPSLVPLSISGDASQQQDAKTPHLSQRQQAELNQIIEKVKARPGKLKTLYVLKRQKPSKSSTTAAADDNNTLRPNHAIIKPLAYWTAEQCVHRPEAERDLPLPLEPGVRIPLTSVHEITAHHDSSKARTPPPPPPPPPSDSHSDDDFQLDGNEEPWETEVGVFRGQAAVWLQPEQTVLDETEETDLAYHPSSMLTREVAGSGFKFAKLVSTPFFGSGIVDLPPGTVKRPKNSRTMHMCFFVFKGRVTVRVGEEIGMGEQEEGGGGGERFSVGKGGVFQVPRGNKYSIENVLDKPARIFFSQGCETVPEG